MKIRVVVALVSAMLLSACGLNSVPTAEEAAKAKWAEVQNQYQRRSDLIPNLVETVRAAGAQEKSVLVEVTNARASANKIQVTNADLSDPAKMAAFENAQAGVTLSLQRLQEAYPELKANENYRTLMHQLEGTENRIANSRRDYGEAVQKYNTLIRTFPDAIGAKIFHGAKPMVQFQAKPEAQDAPKVNFGNSN